MRFSRTRFGSKVIDAYDRFLDFRDWVVSRRLPKIDPISWAFRMKAKLRRVELIEIPQSWLGDSPRGLVISRKTARGISDIRMHGPASYSRTGYSIQVSSGGHYLFATPEIMDFQTADLIKDDIVAFFKDFAEGRIPTVVIREFQSPVVSIRRVG